MTDKVLVTGGLGLVGSYVCRALVASGRRPVIYDSGSDTALVADIAAQCDFVQGNIDDLPRLMGVARDTSRSPSFTSRRRWGRSSSSFRGRL